MCFIYKLNESPKIQSLGSAASLHNYTSSLHNNLGMHGLDCSIHYVFIKLSTNH